MSNTAIIAIIASAVIIIAVAVALIIGKTRKKSDKTIDKTAAQPAVTQSAAQQTTTQAPSKTAAKKTAKQTAAKTAEEPAANSQPKIKNAGKAESADETKSESKQSESKKQESKQTASKKAANKKSAEKKDSAKKDSAKKDSDKAAAKSAAKSDEKQTKQPKTAKSAESVKQSEKQNSAAEKLTEKPAEKLTEKTENTEKTSRAKTGKTADEKAAKTKATEETAVEEIFAEAAKVAETAEIKAEPAKNTAESEAESTIEEPATEPATEPAEEVIIEQTAEPEEAEDQNREETAEPEEIEQIPEPEVKPEPEAEQEYDVPEAPKSRLQRLKAKLSKSSNPFGKALFSILTKDNLTEADWEEIEDTLLLADVGTDASMDLVDDLRADARVTGEKNANAIREMLRAKLMELVNIDADRSLAATREDAKKPGVIIMTGVNGSGKTTTCGKLSRLLVANGKSVVLGAADTFRAAAADQLETWGNRVNVPVVRSDKEGADPASVAFEAASKAVETDCDVLIIDTAGRLQNKANLMEELGKIRRVTEKKLPVDEVLLVLDATIGQNGLAQAKVFSEAIGVTGVVLTKMDGSAKGGIVISVQKELGVPVKLVGLGEGPDDLAPFDPETFVNGILE